MAVMRWYFTDFDLLQDGKFGELLRAIFLKMKPHLKRDDVAQRWIMKDEKKDK